MANNREYDIEFTDKKARYHDKEGVGKKKIKRRMLPSNKGEEFKSRIMTKITRRIKDISKKEASKYNRNKKFKASNFVRLVKDRIFNKTDKIITKAIRDTILKDYIEKGLSPVKGQRQFKKYSEGYLKRIRKQSKGFSGKRTSPADLKLTGKLHKSLRVKKKK